MLSIYAVVKAGFALMSLTVTTQYHGTKQDLDSCASKLCYLVLRLQCKKGFGTFPGAGDRFEQQQSSTYKASPLACTGSLPKL